jgi:hypothetical protein
MLRRRNSGGNKTAGEGVGGEMKTITIKVTKGDIERGIPMNCSRCPIALAANRAGLVDASVSYRVLWTGKDGYSKRSAIPRSALRFMAAFDKGRPVKPFSFRLRVG